MIKILATIFVFMTMLSFNACSDTKVDLEPNKNKRSIAKSHNNELGIEADASHQWEANENLAKLIESFGTTTNRFQEEVPKYPEYYGGAFITNKGNLTVLLHGDQEKGKQNVTSVIGSGTIEFKEAQYSYTQLSETMDWLNDFVINNTKSNALRNFNLFSLMDSENRIVVYLNDYSEERIEEFKKNVSNSPVIAFQKSKGKMAFEANLYPGCKAAVNGSGTSFGPYDFRAKRNSDNVVGMVTAGHVINVGGILYEGGVSIGTCGMSKIVGAVDAAFAPITKEVIMEVQPKEFLRSEEKVAVYKITNHSNVELNLESEYRIERMESNEWRQVPFIKTLVFPDLLYSIAHGETADYPLLISTVIGKEHERTGQYRICKEARPVGRADEKIRLTAEFIIK